MNVECCYIAWLQDLFFRKKSFSKHFQQWRHDNDSRDSYATITHGANVPWCSRSSDHPGTGTHCSNRCKVKLGHLCKFIYYFILWSLCKHLLCEIWSLLNKKIRVLINIYFAFRESNKKSLKCILLKSNTIPLQFEVNHSELAKIILNSLKNLWMKNHCITLMSYTPDM